MSLVKILKRTPPLNQAIAILPLPRLDPDGAPGGGDGGAAA